MWIFSRASMVEISTLDGKKVQSYQTRIIPKVAFNTTDTDKVNVGKLKMSTPNIESTYRFIICKVSPF